MDSSFRARSPSTTHGSYFHDSDQDAHDYTRLRLQQQLAKDLANGSPLGSQRGEDESTMGSLGISEGAGAMSTRKLDDILPNNDILPHTPNLDSKFVNSQFKDFSTIGVAVRNKLFPNMPEEDSVEVGRGASNEPTKTDKSSTLASIFARTAARTASGTVDKGKLAVPNAGINANPRRLSPNSRTRMQPTVVDESMELSSYSIGSRLSGSRRAKSDTKSNKEQAAEEKLQEAARKENLPVRSNGRTVLQTTRRTSGNTALLNTEKLFKDMGFSSDDSTFSEIKPDSPSLRKYRTRAASKPAAPSFTANSIKLPDMTGISDLVSSVDHGTHASNRSQRAAINQVPVPTDEKELLISLRRLERKVHDLEQEKLREKQRTQKLEKNYEDTRQLYENELNGRRKLEIELHDRKRADSALGGEIDSQEGSPRLAAQTLKAQHKAEIKKLDGMVTTYRQRAEAFERKVTLLQDDVQFMTDERNANLNSLANKQAQNEELRDENVALRKDYDEIQQENDFLAGDIERLMKDLDKKDKEIEKLNADFAHERKLMEDKLNRYREKVARASRIATEGTLTANSYQAVARGWRTAATETIQNPEGLAAAKTTVKEMKKAELARQAATKKPTQPTKPAIKITREPEQRVQQQVDAELNKLFPSASAASAASKRKISNSTTASRTSTKPHAKKTRMVVEEYSESESEIGEFPAPEPILNAPYTATQTGESSFVEAHMDTTFTEPSITESRIHREALGDVLPDDETNASFVQSEGIAMLRKELLEERRQLAAFTVQQREAADAKKAHVLAERTARRNDNVDERGAEAKKRVFIYSEKDNEISMTEGGDENNDPAHPFLRTSMLANDTEEQVETGNVLRGLQSDVPSRPSSQQTMKRHISGSSSRRTVSEDVQDNRVQEVVERRCSHDAVSCTICHRRNAVEECQNKGHIANDTFDVEIPEIVPVSRRMEEEQYPFDGEVTMRPSQPPKYALDKVTKQIQDELEHLRADYKEIEAEYLACDPALGRRKRKNLTHQLTEIVEMMDKKADQIYALYDVAEGVTTERTSSVVSDKAGTRRHSTGSRRHGGHIVI